MDNVPQLTMDHDNSGMVKLHASPNNGKHEITKDGYESNSTLNDTSDVEGEIVFDPNDSDTSGVFFANFNDKSLSGNESEDSIKIDAASLESDSAHRSPYNLRSSRSRSLSPVKSRRDTMLPSEVELLVSKINANTKENRSQILQQKYSRYMLPPLNESEEEITNAIFETNSTSSVENSIDSEINDVQSEKTETKLKMKSNDPYILNINVHLPKEFIGENIPLNFNIIKESSTSRTSLNNESYPVRPSSSLNPNDTTFESTGSVSYHDWPTTLISDGTNDTNKVEEKKNDSEISKEISISNANVLNCIDNDIYKPSTSKHYNVLNDKPSDSAPLNDHIVKDSDEVINSEEPHPQVTVIDPHPVEKKAPQKAKKESKPRKRRSEQTASPKQQKAEVEKKTKNNERKQPAVEKKKKIVHRPRKENNENQNQQEIKNKSKDKHKTEGIKRRHPKKFQICKRRILMKHCRRMSISDMSDSSSTESSDNFDDSSSTSFSSECSCCCDCSCTSYTSSSSD